MGAQFKVRELKFNDFEDLVKNYWSYYDEKKGGADLGLVFFKSKPTLNKEVDWFRKLYLDTLEDNTIAIVAEADGHVVGMCDIHRSVPGSETDHVGTLGIAIVKGYRAKGVGKALLAEALRKAKGKFELIVLKVVDGNAPARHLYEKFGFKEYGKLRHGIKRGRKYKNEALMFLELD